MRAWGEEQAGRGLAVQGDRDGKGEGNIDIIYKKK